jgi:flavodoxin
MKFKVVYFSRTGTSKRIAEKIGEGLSCDVIEISDNMNWGGIFGYIKAGFYSSTNRNVDIEIHGNIDAADEFIVVTPLWAGGAVPAVRAFLKTTPKDKIHLVVTSDGSNFGNSSGFKSVSNIAKKNNNEDEIISNFIKKLS